MGKDLFHDEYWLEVMGVALEAVTSITLFLTGNAVDGQLVILVFISAML
jgi:hypothetical protein